MSLPLCKQMWWSVTICFAAPLLWPLCCDDSSSWRGNASRLSWVCTREVVLASRRQGSCARHYVVLPGVLAPLEPAGLQAAIGQAGVLTELRAFKNNTGWAATCRRVGGWRPALQQRPGCCPTNQGRMIQGETAEVEGVRHWGPALLPQPPPRRHDSVCCHMVHRGCSWPITSP